VFILNNLKPSGMNTYGKKGEKSPFCTILVQSKSLGINTYKSVSKQTTLSTFRINIYEKHRGGQERVTDGAEP
jgi:hypothetical protein